MLDEEPIVEDSGLLVDEGEQIVEQEITVADPDTASDVSDAFLVDSAADLTEDDGVSSEVFDSPVDMVTSPENMVSSEGEQETSETIDTSNIEQILSVIQQNQKIIGDNTNLFGTVSICILSMILGICIIYCFLGHLHDR